jgi:lysozyme
MLLPMIALNFLAVEEGIREDAYQDSRGIWTLGVGMTTLNGHPVKQGDRLTRDQACWSFGALAQEFYEKLQDMLHVELNDNQTAAVVSLAYNIGLGAFRSSTILRKLNAKDASGAANEFLRWTRAGSDPNLLKPRRTREKALFEKQMYITIIPVTT